jgi:hypothetical protein
MKTIERICDVRIIKCKFKFQGGNGRLQESTDSTDSKFLRCLLESRGVHWSLVQSIGVSCSPLESVESVGFRCSGVHWSPGVLESAVSPLLNPLIIFLNIKFIYAVWQSANMTFVYIVGPKSKAELIGVKNINKSKLNYSIF